MRFCWAIFYLSWWKLWWVCDDLFLRGECQFSHFMSKFSSMDTFPNPVLKYQSIFHFLFNSEVILSDLLWCCCPLHTDFKAIAQWRWALPQCRFRGQLPHKINTPPIVPFHGLYIKSRSRWRNVPVCTFISSWHLSALDSSVSQNLAGRRTLISRTWRRVTNIWLWPFVIRLWRVPRRRLWGMGYRRRPGRMGIRRVCVIFLPMSQLHL